jgi:hypothetical protein
MLITFSIFIFFVFSSGSEDSWFYIWRTEPNSSGNATSISAKLTGRQRRYFDRAFERIRGEKQKFLIQIIDLNIL